MTRRMTTLAALLVLGFSSSILAKEIQPSEIRESFWKSEDETLKLAAEALGDDGLTRLLEELRGKKEISPAAKKTLQRLKTR